MFVCKRVCMRERERKREREKERERERGRERERERSYIPNHYQELGMNLDCKSN